MKELEVDKGKRLCTGYHWFARNNERSKKYWKSAKNVMNIYWSPTNVGDQYMFITFLADFQYFVDLSRCKGVRCPPIFSLFNLITGTNRKAYLLHASFALKDSHCHWSSILILLWSNNWCLNIYILMNCVRVRDLRFGTYVRVRWFPCGSYVNFHGPARVAIQGLTWVNFRFLANSVNSGRPAWSMVRTRGKLLMATAQVTRVSAGEL